MNHERTKEIMNMRKLVTILAVLALFPAMAVADDLSANFTSGGQGFASLQTSGTTISYGIIVGGIGNPTGAQILQGGNVFVDLNANFSNGSANGTATTSSANIAALNANTGNYTLRVQGSGGTATGTLVNNGGTTSGGAGELGFSAGTYTVLENAGTATITVGRSGGIDGVVTVDYATSDGTGVAGTDYMAANGTLTWADGDAAVKTFDITVFDNGAEDGDKTVNINLSNATGGADLGLSEALLTITDDESLVCNPGPTTLCLNVNERFRAEITWTDGTNGGDGQVFDIGLRDSGLFYFFSEDNAEMLLKVLDACNSDFNAFWVFYAATTNLGFDLTITDTQTGAVRTYNNPLGNFAETVLDTAAFSTCP